MTYDERLKLLLSKGYFPKELPPPFTSHQFSQSIDAVKATWSTFSASLSQAELRSYPPTSSYTRFDMARKGHSRRILGVPNPVNQYYLTDAIAEKQDEFEQISSQSAISLTPANVSEGSRRAVSMPNLSILSEKRIAAYATAQAILQTDVLSFYHAIYTHSVPWALHGKRAAKRNRSVSDPAFFGNKIDTLLRAGQDGQTIGIPVGPDTSRIISEIILCAIEKNINSEIFSKVSAGYRYMDDLFLCFQSHVDAESFLAALRDSVLSFDLQLNASKTRIIDALAFNEEIWPGEIAQLKIGRSPEDQRRNIIRFFTEVIKHSKTLPDESIASFAIRKTSRVLIQRDNWDIYESFILRIARENSNCLDSIVKILCTYAAIGYPISVNVKSFIESMIEAHAPYNHYYEVAWVLWLCRSLNIKIGERATKLVAKVENSICACLVLMLRGRRLLTGRGSVTDWIGDVTKDDLYGQHWMVIYEAGTRLGWALPGAKEAVDDDPHFKALRDEKVTFFDTRTSNMALELPTINHLLSSALEGRKSAMLPGAIYFERSTPLNQRKYEKLGEDYGGDDDGPWSILSSDWGQNSFDLDDEPF